jgi:hypothetical protein
MKIVKIIEGKRCVPAWSYEKGAFFADGDWWRVL